MIMLLGTASRTAFVDIYALADMPTYLVGPNQAGKLMSLHNPPWAKNHSLNYSYLSVSIIPYYLNIKFYD